MASKNNNKRLVKLKNYIVASINLYGVIQVDDLLKLITMHEQDVYTKEDIIQVVEMLATIDSTGISFKQNIISCGYYELHDGGDFQLVKQLLQTQASKPRYIPSKQEFLRYESDYYIEPLEPLLRLEKFIKDNNLVKIKNKHDIMEDLEELHDQIVFDVPLSHFMDYITDRGYHFKDDMMMELFIGFINDIHNNTRMFVNNGFTPTELRNYYLNKERQKNQ